MTFLLLATVVIGFAPIFCLAGVFRAPLPSPMVHVYGAVFSSWMLLLLVQTGLISAKRVSWHRSLGLAGFLLARVMDQHIISAQTDFEVGPIFIWNAHYSPS